MDRVTLTEAELIEALSEALGGDEPPEGFLTRAEIQRLTGWSRNKTHLALQSLFDMGRLEVSKVSVPSISGDVQRRPAYRILPGD